MKQTEILVKSTLDGSLQPSLFYKSENPDRPLLVGLHTWSHDRFNQIENMLPYAEKYDFNLLLPEFRGANLKSNPICTQACGSRLARQDVKDAIDAVADMVDKDNIFLLGLSGGGHMALLMAGFIPEYFKAIGSYVPITDLKKWHSQNPDYADNLMACCQTEAEMADRSPMSYIDTIAKSNIKIFHGKYDPVVPVSHSLEIFDAIMKKYPTSRVFLDIFDGGHEIDMEQALYWLLSQYKGAEKTKVTG
ncbi:MAG: prolyl oligopeptidase family serine peptidase [Clostridia bacterium]|nr:prolyl oligopeptidase family serine peptidase [Clostridia bacterium]